MQSVASGSGMRGGINLLKTPEIYNNAHKFI